MTLFAKGRKFSKIKKILDEFSIFSSTLYFIFKISTLLFGPPLKFKTFPDGGRAAWSVVGGVFVSYGLAFGLLRVFSVLLNPIQSYYGVSQTTAMLAPGLFKILYYSKYQLKSYTSN